MRKLAVLLLGTLLMTSNVFAAVNLNAEALAKSIMNPGKATVTSDKGRFNIVYGGQDISRTSLVGNNPVLVG